MKKIIAVFTTVIAAVAAAAAPLSAFSAEDVFRAGFGRTDITPALGTPMPGYYGKRLVSGVLDPLEASALAVSDGSNTAVVVAMDTISTDCRATKAIADAVTAATGIPAEALFLHSSHTHTGGSTRYAVNAAAGVSEADLPAVDAYTKLLASRVAEAVKAAVADLAPAEIAVGRTTLERHAFIRRYLMKDGSTRTNPGTRNPEVDSPIGEPDTMLQVVRFKRAAPKKEITVVNFQNHPDVIGGSKASADWPGFARRTVEAAIDRTRCIFVNGAQGDTNHLIWKARPGESEADIYDPENKGYAYKRYENSRNMGMMVAGAAVSVWGRCEPVAAGEVKYGIAKVRVPSNRPKPEEMEQARRYLAAHNAGRKHEIPATSMAYTTIVAGAARKVRLEHGPDFFDLPVSALAIGRSVAFAGFPGEPFTEIGVKVKAGSPFRTTIVGCTTNGSFGYFPVSSAFAEGGYEASTSSFTAEVAPKLVSGQLEQLRGFFR
jgi:hypothetical protein